jgi:phenylacetic acid degradation operon negative regulatory protein
MTETRPLSARSVVLSTLLGTSPPRLPIRRLVIAADLFGIAEGTVRTAVTRMTGRGEVHAEGDGWYLLGDALVERQRRQADSRVAATHPWSGEWTMAVVTAEARPAADRAALRSAMALLRFAEQRDGVWLRPDNLPADRLPSARAVIAAQVTTYTARPDLDAAELAAALWDLGAWIDRAATLGCDLERAGADLTREPTRDALADGFTTSAAVLRHFQADPLLPPELCGPDWNGDALRADFGRFDTLYRSSLSRWFAAHDPGPRD